MSICSQRLKVNALSVRLLGIEEFALASNGGEAEKTRRDQHRKFWELQLKKQEPPKV
jgi:hypothetical protein